MAAQNEEPRIVLLSLNRQSYFDQMYSSLLKALIRRARVQRAIEPASAMKLLVADPPPLAVLMTDEALTHKENGHIWEVVLQYVRNGGTAVAMGHFSSFMQPDDVRPFFSKADLPWDQGAYHRTTLGLNKAAVGPVLVTRLCSQYSLKAMYLSNVAPTDSWYITKENSVFETLSGARGNAHTPGQSPVTFAQVGEGRLGYVGDVNAEEGSDYVVLAMCGLAF